MFKLFGEQTSHHPPISNILIENEDVQISGNFELKGKTSGNSYLIQNYGCCTVLFKDTSQKISYFLPEVVMKGIIWGSTTLHLSSSITFIDRANQFKSSFIFENDTVLGSLYKFDPSV